MIDLVIIETYFEVSIEEKFFYDQALKKNLAKLDHLAYLNIKKNVKATKKKYLPRVRNIRKS